MAGNLSERGFTPPQEGYPSPDYARAAELTPDEEAATLAGLTQFAHRKGLLTLPDNVKTLLRTIMDKIPEETQESLKIDYAAMRTPTIDLKAQRLMTRRTGVTAPHTLMDAAADLPAALDEWLVSDANNPVSVLLNLQLTVEKQQFERGNKKYGKSITTDPVIQSVTRTINDWNDGNGSNDGSPQTPDITSTGRPTPSRRRRAA